MADACAVRSLSTASLSLASFAAGSACAFSTLSRRSLVLLNWVAPVLAVCVEAGLQRDNIGIDPRHRGFERAVLCRAERNPRPSAFQRPPSPVRRRERQPPSPAPPRQPSPPIRRLPDDASAAAASGFASMPMRSPGDMIITLPGKRGSAGFTASILGRFDLRRLILGGLLGSFTLGSFQLYRLCLGPHPPWARRPWAPQPGGGFFLLGCESAVPRPQPRLLPARPVRTYWGRPIR